MKYSHLWECLVLDCFSQGTDWFRLIICEVIHRSRSYHAAFWPYECSERSHKLNNNSQSLELTSVALKIVLTALIPFISLCFETKSI